MGPAVLCNAASWVQSSTDPFHSGNFLLGIVVGFDSIAYCLRLESKLTSSLCTHAFRHMDSKDSDIHVLDGWMSATKTHPACIIHEGGTWLPLWLNTEKERHMNKIWQKTKVNTTDLAGKTGEEEELGKLPSAYAHEWQLYHEMLAGELQTLDLNLNMHYLQWNMTRGREL